MVLAPMKSKGKPIGQQLLKFYQFARSAGGPTAPMRLAMKTMLAADKAAATTSGRERSETSQGDPGDYRKGSPARLRTCPIYTDAELIERRSGRGEPPTGRRPSRWRGPQARRQRDRTSASSRTGRGRQSNWRRRCSSVRAAMFGLTSATALVRSATSTYTSGQHRGTPRRAARSPDVERLEQLVCPVESFPSGNGLLHPAEDDRSRSRSRTIGTGPAPVSSVTRSA